MRFLFDIGHPAHIHLFRHFAMEMQEDGHEILFTIRDKDITVHLVEGYGLPYVSLGKAKKGVVGKLSGLWDFNRKLFRIARNFRPDFLLSHGSIYAAHVSALLRKPHISFEDTGNMEQILLYKPFTKAILVSDSFTRDMGRKAVTYPGYHELAYLHPRRFKPDREVVRQYGIQPDQPTILMRFVSWEATHDIQHAGIPLKLKEDAVHAFAQRGRVLISSEGELPNSLKPYQIKIDPLDIFHVMAHCRLVFGESGTMASEAAVLGVPAVYIDSTSRDYTQEQEKKYGLVFNFSESQDAIKAAIRKGIDILDRPDLRDSFAEGHRRLLADKVDVTAFLRDYMFGLAGHRHLKVPEKVH